MVEFFLYLLTGILYIPSLLLSMYILAMAGDPIQTEIQEFIFKLMLIFYYITLIGVWVYFAFFLNNLFLVIIWAIFNPIFTLILIFLWFRLLFHFLMKKTR